MIKGIRHLVMTWKITCSIIGLVLLLGVGALLFAQLQNENRLTAEKASIKKTEAVVEITPSINIQKSPLKLTEISQKKDVSIYPAPQTSVAEEKEEDQFLYLTAVPLSEDLQQLIYERCQEEELDYHLVLGLIWRESEFNVNAVGYNTNGTVDTGLMQINDANRKFLRETYGIDNLFDPEQNILAGTSLLGDWAEKHGQHYAIMAYRSGEYGMLRKKAGGITTDWSVEIVYEKGKEYLALIEDARSK